MLRQFLVNDYTAACTWNGETNMEQKALLFDVNEWCLFVLETGVYLYWEMEVTDNFPKLSF